MKMIGIKDTCTHTSFNLSIYQGNNFKAHGNTITLVVSKLFILIEISDGVKDLRVCEAAGRAGAGLAQGY